MTTHRRIDGADLEAIEDDLDQRIIRHRRRNDETSIAAEIAKVVIPVLLAWGIAYITAQSTVATEVAVVRATENAHFEEIQRTLKRLDDWISQQQRGKQ